MCGHAVQYRSRRANRQVLSLADAHCGRKPKQPSPRFCASIGDFEGRAAYGFTVNV
jgi:hypothetical protein